MSVNIPRSITDTFYRYKREMLKIKHTGGGNGKITKIENLPKVCKQMERTEEQISKWFSSDLNSPIVAHNGVYSLKGHFTVDQLEDSIEKFVLDFVLCKTCGNPETVIGINSQNIYLRCRSCGGVGEAKSKNKVSEYILKDKSLRDKTLKDTSKTGEFLVVKKKEDIQKDYTELKEFIAQNKFSHELNSLRDKLRLTPKELSEKICEYLLENNSFVSNKKWNVYFLNDLEKTKMLLDLVMKKVEEKEKIVNTVFTLYEMDYIKEDNILEWYDTLPSETDDELKSKLNIVPFIHWLETPEEDSE